MELLEAGALPVRLAGPGLLFLVEGPVSLAASSFLTSFGSSSSFLTAEGPLQMTEGRKVESVLLVGLLVSSDTEYSDPALVVGEGLVVSVIKVGDVVDTATWGDTGLEAMAAS